VIVADSTIPVEPAHYVTHLRGDTRLDDRLPAHLCRIIPEASAVRLERRDSTVEEVPCP